MKNQNQLSPLAIGFIGILIMFSVGLNGYLYAKVSMLEKQAGAGAAAVPNGNNQAAAQQPQQPSLDVSKIPAVSDKDHIRGSKDAQIVLVEYSDYECPYCKAFHPTMQQLTKDYGNKVAWVFRNYPLSFHPKAEKSAEGAECAAELGGNDAFWKYTDAVYTQMPGLELSQLPDVAKSIGIDATKFKTCLDSGKYADKVKNDENGGVAGGVQGTPGTFVIGKNGKTDFINGANPVDQAKQIIDKVISG